MKISILIVTRKWNSDIHALNYIMELKDNNLDFEVLLAEGNNPSSQRNTLANCAQGEYLLFLDDDSIPVIELLERYWKTLLAYPNTDILGGPSLIAGNRSFFYGLSKIFFSSTFGIGPIKSRYNSFGAVRKATERDLILCNLLIKKDFFLKTKGFNHSLYPGEENEFLKNLNTNTQIIYDPEAIVYREPRASFYLFLKQMFSYGKGRSKHLKLNYFYDYVFLIPLFFSLFVLSSPFIYKHAFFFGIPLSLHLVFSLSTLVGHKDDTLTISKKCLLPFFFFLGHFSYGLGLIVGILKYKILRRVTKTKHPEEKIQIHKLKSYK